MSGSSPSRLAVREAHRLCRWFPVFSGLPVRRISKVLSWNLAIVIFLLLLIAEARSSWLESRIFTVIAGHESYRVSAGASERIAFPKTGPYDERLGYSSLPFFIERAKHEGYVVSAQARDSIPSLTLSRAGVYPIYREKAQAGLQVLDRDGQAIAGFHFPGRTYGEYAEIPGVVVETLLFMENRTILDPSHPHRNPAVEWGRLSHAVVDYGLHALNRRHRSIGGSTLATQLEKVRHSPQGRTHSPGEKIDQMVSASLRAYADGPQTLAAQQRIVCDYLNSLPLGATQGYGEVIGLGDGLWAWYSTDFAEVNRLLSAPAETLDVKSRERQALDFRRVLSLLIATRSPLRYLVTEPTELAEETNRYLRLLAAAQILPPELRDLALRQPSSAEPAPPSAEIHFVDNKATDLVRSDLSSLLGVDSHYALDRLDLSVLTTIDQPTQQKVTSTLRGLTGGDRQIVARLREPRLLAGSDPRSVIYSFTLYERSAGLNMLRVQTDTFNEPLNINRGTRLELGSTAKLRTLILYLEIVEQLRSAYLSGMQPKTGTSDPLTAWATGYLLTAADKNLGPMLEAALDRKYSASPAEGFFTAGGLHQFNNFERSDNGRTMTVREAFEHSVNLVFIRLMRDIERYYLARLPAVAGGAGLTAEERQQYLVRFADQEGEVYLGRFYRKYERQSVSEALEGFGRAYADAPRRLAVIYRSVLPDAPAAELVTYLHQYVLRGLVTDPYIKDLYQKYAPDNFSLEDRGYLAGVHPLELWLLWYKARHPQATLSEYFRASAQQRQEAYTWLFSTRHGGAQDLRIRILEEQDAFEPITREWKRLGYPFETLVPSYATAIGVSGDTPAALAELMGILGSGGVRYPSTSLRELRFAEATPVATTLKRQPGSGERVLSEEIAAAVRAELIAVVERGTARRAAGGVVLKPSMVLPLGGKTGTGDNRIKIYAGRGYFAGSRVASRTAVFVFMVGDRFFGTVMAFVPGKAAGGYEFTSALAVQVFKELEPALKPLLERSQGAEQ